MVKFEITDIDPVLVAADEALEKREASRPRRLHLGMSSAGRCAREQYYNWLWTGGKPIAARGLKAIDDGNRGEDVVAARLQAVDAIQLMTVDPETGRQWEVTDAGGHVRGHMDGIIYHHPTASATTHVWECKITAERKLNEFRKIKARDGSKATLRQWNFVYWVQAQLYMLYGGYTRHWCVVASAGCRDWDACRTELMRDEAEFYAERLRDMVDQVDELPARVSESPNAFECKWCDFRSICHERAPVEKNCRTCRHARPVEGPQWHCTLHDELLSPDKQAVGCEQQSLREVLA